MSGTDLTLKLILIGVGLVVIGIGAVMLYFGRYLAATEDQKRSRARQIWIYGIIWLCIGIFHLIGSLLVLRG